MIDAARGDVVYYYQRSVHEPIGSGSGTAGFATVRRSARLDHLAFTPDGPNAVTATLAEVPQTSWLRGDVRYTRFAHLTPRMAPAGAATPDSLGLAIFGNPATSDRRILLRPAAHVLLFSKNFDASDGAVPDTDYGPLRYGRFLRERLWRYVRKVTYQVQVKLTAPGAGFPDRDGFPAFYESGGEETGVSAFAAIRPHMSPVTPFINGAEAFETRQGVGLQPTLSWSEAGRDDEETDDEETDDEEASDDHSRTLTYLVTIHEIRAFADGTSFMDQSSLLNISTSRRSITLPSGVLKQGTAYFATITATRGNLVGVRGESVDTVTGVFVP